MDTSIELAGLTIGAPVTAFTNLVLSVQCAVYSRRVRTGRPDRGGYWSLFFLAMAVATSAGVAKHGLAHVLPSEVYRAVLWAASLGSAASVFFAQRATWVSRTSPTIALRLTRLSEFQVTLFVGASLALGPEMWLVVVNTAVGLLPVIAVEVRSVWRAAPEGAWIAAGLILSMLTGVVYVTRLGVGPWLNHVDVAHLLMGASFALMARDGLVEHRRRR